MPPLSIRLFPDPILRRPSASADWRSPEIKRLIKDMTATLYAQPGGIGIAASQVGVARRVIVVDVSPKDPTKGRIVMMNPVIRRLEGEILNREGCMSLPDYTANVIRATRVWVEWTNENGKRCQKITAGIEAICLQHELDHLNGKLFIDLVASLKTDVFPRKAKKK